MDADTFYYGFGLGYLDSIRLYADSPALDPILINWENKGCDKQLAEAVHNCLSVLRGRLFNAGFNQYSQGLIAKPKTLECIANYLHFKSLRIRAIRDSLAGNDLYILTKQANGRLFIHPPYDNNKIIFWEDYFSRITRGEKLPLMIDVPWAQAKIVSIE